MGKSELEWNRAPEKDTAELCCTYNCIGLCARVYVYVCVRDVPWGFLVMMVLVDVPVDSLHVQEPMQDGVKKVVDDVQTGEWQ